MENKMKKIRIEKVTLNIGIGESGERLTKATKLLTSISKAKAIQTKSMKRIPTWGVRPNLAIACKVTVRKEKAEELLGRLLNATKNILSESKFDNFGNFSFGIPEYIDISGVEYDPDVGIIGLEVAVTLERPGFRIKNRIKKEKIPARHKISKKEAMDFIQSKYKTEIIGD